MKRALLVGINYRGSKAELKGCINDVQHMKTYLLSQGYLEKNIAILTDDTENKPTKINIVNEFTKLLLSNGKRLFFHYSGHGSWERDRDGDEDDKRDESLVPLDFKTAGTIVDDQLRGLIRLFMNKNSHLSIVLDCCHSGTGVDLRYTLTTVTEKQKRYIKGRWITRNIARWACQPSKRYPDTPGQVILISGCQDVQYSADAYQEGKYQGALTCCLLQCLRNSNSKNWQQLLLSLRKLLKDKKYAQIANLTTGRPIRTTFPIDFA